MHVQDWYARSATDIKQPPRIRLCRSASGAPLGGEAAEGRSGGDQYLYVSGL